MDTVIKGTPAPIPDTEVFINGNGHVAIKQDDEGLTHTVVFDRKRARAVIKAIRAALLDYSAED